MHEERHPVPRVYGQARPLAQYPLCARARTSAQAAAYMWVSMLHGSPSVCCLPPFMP
jgi:hypothetical protein